ncbi:MAG TPA: glycerol-3-phosphate dehydrogenase [Burkholderiaceae bacterium]
MTQVDVLVVGGGINGCGIARDLAGRGFSVLLAERDDLAAHTSSASTKLVHGGLRYLEQYEFALVRKALQEREVLMKGAPHLIRPLRFVMPHDAGLRPAWMIRAGLFLYDHLARREVLPDSGGIDLRRHIVGLPLQRQFKRGFVYSDGWVDDARLVVANAIDARERGATILTRSLVQTVARSPAGWSATIATASGERRVQARALVNAAGPWAESFLRGVAQETPGRSLRLVKGSHIVVPQLFTHDHAYIFQAPDQRIIFAIPYEGRFTLIGTTDLELSSAALDSPLAISAAETDYLCAQVSRYFAKPLKPSDVVWSYAGVRPLLDDAEGSASAVTRDYLLERHTEGGAPLLSIWGGKITTFRRLAEDAADALCEMLATARPRWTEHAPLPGGDLSLWIGPAQRPDLDFECFVSELARRHPWLPAPLLRRLAHAYGARVSLVLGGAHALSDLGAEVAPGLFEAELDYLRREEWALSSEDVLWRRSKLGLHLSAQQRAQVAARLAG